MKQAGEAVRADEPLVELETDKVTVEVNAPIAGVLTAIAVPEGGEVEVGALLGVLDAGCRVSRCPDPPASAAGVAGGRAARRPTPLARRRAGRAAAAPAAPVARPAHAARRSRRPPPRTRRCRRPPSSWKSGMSVAGAIGDGTGKDGRITKGDVLAFLNRPAPAPAPAAPAGEAAAGRRAARAAGAHDAAAPHHRGAAEGGAEHRGDADHLQRGGHVGGDGAAQRVSRGVREEARAACGWASCRSSCRRASPR